MSNLDIVILVIATTGIGAAVTHFFYQSVVFPNTRELKSAALPRRWIQVAVALLFAACFAGVVILAYEYNVFGDDEGSPLPENVCEASCVPERGQIEALKEELRSNSEEAATAIHECQSELEQAKALGLEQSKSADSLRRTLVKTEKDLSDATGEVSRLTPCAEIVARYEGASRRFVVQEYDSVSDPVSGVTIGVTYTSTSGSCSFQVTTPDEKQHLFQHVKTGETLHFNSQNGVRYRVVLAEAGSSTSCSFIVDKLGETKAPIETEE